MKTESNRIKLTSKNNTAHATAQMDAKHGVGQSAVKTMFIVRSASARGGYWGTGQTLTEAEKNYKKAGGRMEDVQSEKGRCMFIYPADFQWEIEDGRVCSVGDNEGVDRSLIKYTYL